jgi:hypothetical protein
MALRALWQFMDRGDTLSAMNYLLSVIYYYYGIRSDIHKVVATR